MARPADLFVGVFYQLPFLAVSFWGFQESVVGRRNWLFLSVSAVLFC